MENNKALAIRVKQLCEEKGMTRSALAEKSGVPLRRIQRMTMAGVSNPSVFQMMDICKALGVTLDEFFDDDVFKKECE